jgi:hypothetical protein
MNLKNPRTLYGGMAAAILAAAMLFIFVCFRIDAARPDYQLRPSTPFPLDIFPSPSEKYLRPDSAPLPRVPSEASTHASGNDPAADPFNSGASAASASGSPNSETERSILGYAKALKDAQPTASASMEEIKDREALLSAAQKIEDYRALSPTGPLPRYLNWEINTPELKDALMRAPARIGPYGSYSALSPDPMKGAQPPLSSDPLSEAAESPFRFDDPASLDSNLSSQSVGASKPMTSSPPQPLPF